jgi:hypothetical protein
MKRIFRFFFNLKETIVIIFAVIIFTIMMKPWKKEVDDLKI